MTTDKDDDRLRLLSDAERAAMEDDDYDPEEDNKAALAEIGRGNLDSGDDDADDAEKGAGVGKPDPDKPGTDADKGAAKKDDDASKADDPNAGADPESGEGDKGAAPAPAPAPSAAPALKADLPKDYDDQVAANKAAITELRKKFDDGEVDASEYHAQLDDLNDRRADLRDIKTKADLAREMNEQAAQNAWVSTINTFLGEAATKAELGIVDYAKDAEKQADLDSFVKALANTKGNENKPSRWFLEEAHKRVVALHGIPTTKKAADPKRKPDASAVVQNLSDVPGGAGDADPMGDEFAELDKLEGLDYERAMAKMSADQRDKYLRTL